MGHFEAFWEEMTQLMCRFCLSPSLAGFFLRYILPGRATYEIVIAVDHMVEAGRTVTSFYNDRIQKIRFWRDLRWTLLLRCS